MSQQYVDWTELERGWRLAFAMKLRAEANQALKRVGDGPYPTACRLYGQRLHEAAAVLEEERKR